jgi:putative membrane protein
VTIVRRLISGVILVLLILFALSNREPTTLRLWPTDIVVQLPLALAILGSMAVAFLFGALVLWLGVLNARRRARRAEHAVRLMEAQVAELKAQLRPPARPGPLVPLP